MTDHHPEEMVPADDRIIGRAFKLSLVVIVVLVVTIGGVVWVVSRPDPETVPQDVPEIVAIRPERSVDPPTVRFTDITSASGISAVHDNGARGEKLLPETMGGGCAVFDYDGDGDQDLFLVNGTRWPDDPGTATPPVQSLWAVGRSPFEIVRRRQYRDCRHQSEHHPESQRPTHWVILRAP